MAEPQIRYVRSADGTNIASRICALSGPGEILVSDIVRGLAWTSAGVRLGDRGEHALKGIADAVRVYAVRAEGDG